MGVAGAGVDGDLVERYFARVTADREQRAVDRVHAARRLLVADIAALAGLAALEFVDAFSIHSVTLVWVGLAAGVPLVAASAVLCRLLYRSHR